MSRTPLPGRQVRGSRHGRPIMALTDLLGRAWAQRILWELRADRLTFRDLQAACEDPSPTIVNHRLKELREAELVDHISGQGYGLTTLGQELLDILLPLNVWAEKWARELKTGATGSTRT